MTPESNVAAAAAPEKAYEEAPTATADAIRAEQSGAIEPHPAPDRSENLTPDDLKHALREMLRIRRSEEQVMKLYRAGEFGGFCHVYNGQEAVAIGSVMAKQEKDDILTTYRDHGLAIACGMTPEAMIGELLGREIGCSKGRGGSMHMFDREKHMHGGHGIVGAHISLAAGLAFANKYKENGQCALSMLGDGAVPNQGFHESLNLTGLWNLPYVVMIENNGFGMGTAVDRANAIDELWMHAISYDMIGMVCDGTDFFSMYNTVSEALHHARQNHPVLIEVRTYRYFGHSMSDPVHGVYRTKDEVNEAKLRDPITRLSTHLMEGGHLTEEQFKAMDKEITQEMKDAVAKAKESPEPSTDEVYDYIYANPEGMNEVIDR